MRHYFQAFNTLCDARRSHIAAASLVRHAGLVFGFPVWGLGFRGPGSWTWISRISTLLGCPCRFHRLPVTFASNRNRVKHAQLQHPLAPHFPHRVLPSICRPPCRLHIRVSHSGDGSTGVRQQAEQTCTWPAPRRQRRNGTGLTLPSSRASARLQPPCPSPLRLPSSGAAALQPPAVHPTCSLHDNLQDEKRSARAVCRIWIQGQEAHLTLGLRRRSRRAVPLFARGLASFAQPEGRVKQLRPDHRLPQIGRQR